MRLAKRGIPKLRQRDDGRYLVRLDDHDFYLGRDRPAAEIQYQRLIGEWFANGGRMPRSSEDEDDRILIGEMVLLYLDHAAGYYRGPDGKPTGQMPRVRAAMRLLVRSYADLPAAEFSPKKFRALREYIVEAHDYARTTINHYMAAIQAMFRWAVECEHVPPDVFQGLAAVQGLRAGRTDAREAPPVPPVSDAVVDATLPYLPDVVADMVRVQRRTGMRPGELVIMRPCEIDMSGQVWRYTPSRHKTAHCGHHREIAIGPRARAIIEPRLGLIPAAYLFKPSRGGDEHYSTASYGRAVERGAQRAGVEHWRPNRLRHSAAGDFEREAGWNAAGVLLGHSKPNTTAIYVERDRRAADDVVRRIG